jgi:condensation enzyme
MLDPPRDSGRLPLSFNQELLCMFDSGSEGGPFGPRYHIIIGRRLTGPLDVATLRVALTDVVDRHEPLRTNLIRTDGGPYQRVYPASPPRLAVRESPGVPPGERTHRAEAALGELEASLIEADELPHLRAVLVRFDEQDAVLVLIAHHLATDGVSMGLIVRDLAACYAARRAGTVAELPPVQPYRDFVAWERECAASEPAAEARRYWAETLRGARFTALPADYPKSADRPQATAVYRFDIDAALRQGVKRLARSARCSPFMVLMAAYCQLVHQITGVTDIVVSTHTLGRPVGRFDNTVGSFFNFLPLRVDLAGCQDVRDLLVRVRSACVGAYEYEIPAVQVFETAPDLMAPAMADHLTPVTFQSFPTPTAPGSTRVGDLTYTVVQRNASSLAVTSDIPDGGVLSVSLDPAEGRSGDLAYRTNRFDGQTIVRLAADYQRALARLLTGSDDVRARPAVAP